MTERTMRGFITHRAWAELPRALDDRWCEGGSFDLDAV
jgi:hypothetical protein